MINDKVTKQISLLSRSSTSFLMWQGSHAVIPGLSFLQGTKAYEYC